MYGRTNKQPFTVERIAPRIYLANFEDNYDLAMTFCRYQEYYESASDEFRGKKFKLIDFMEYYARTFGDGGFTYAKDWGGFNIPGKLALECYQLHQSDRDFANNNCDLNRYDEWMRMITYQCLVDGDDFYLIGTVGNESSMYRHELAHALYYTSPEYKFEMNQLVNGMRKKDNNIINAYLAKIGYAEGVFKDETQAYFATGLTAELKKTLRLQKYIASFQEVFNRRAPKSFHAVVTK